MAGVRHLPAAIDPLSFAVSGLLSRFVVPFEIIKKRTGSVLSYHFQSLVVLVWRPLSDHPVQSPLPACCPRVWSFSFRRLFLILSPVFRGSYLFRLFFSSFLLLIRDPRFPVGSILIRVTRLPGYSVVRSCCSLSLSVLII